MTRSTLALAALAAISAPAHAAVTTVGAVPNAPPAGGGAVVGAFTIGDGSFGSVTVSGGTPISSVGNATLGNFALGVGVVSLSGFASDWTITGASADITLGDEGVGQITVASSARMSVIDATTLGLLSASSGKLTVTGLGSFYDTGGNFTVGSSGVGIVDVLAGGGIESQRLLVGSLAGSEGTVTLSGDLSRWATSSTVVVGDAGQGTLSVLDAARFLAGSGFTVGDNAGSHGTVEVSGSGSLVADSLTIGNSGVGNLLVQGGGRVTTSGPLNLSTLASSFGRVIVDGHGSRLTTGLGGVDFGAGFGEVLLSNGGTLATTDASTITPRGRLTLAGGRFESDGFSFSVQGLLEGSGTVASTVNTSGASSRIQTRTGDQLLITRALNNNGFVDLAGGELEVAGLWHNGNGADLDARNGAILRATGGLTVNSGSQLSITGGTVDIFGAVNHVSGGQIAVVGGSTAVFHDAVTSNGSIFVSASSEIVLLENLAFVPSSSLGIQLGRIDPLAPPTDAFGLVSVGGAATLGGEIEVSLAGYTPTIGDTFTVLDAAGGRTGVFATESLPALGGNLALDVRYTPDSVLLAVVPALTGDYNADGLVNAADYSVWRDALGSTTSLAADGNANGVIDAADRAVWAANYGATAAANSLAVPEPVGLVLVALLLPLLGKAGPRRDGPR